jgi:hypothetical protein
MAFVGVSPPAPLQGPRPSFPPPPPPTPPLTLCSSPLQPGPQINDKFEEQQQEKKAYYEEMNNSLLNLHCGVDDSHVDYVNVWKRQYDAAKDR